MCWAVVSQAAASAAAEQRVQAVQRENDGVAARAAKLEQDLVRIDTCDRNLHLYCSLSCVYVS